jgi:predicted SnoaL-like aldol condensation-catalyzing enzyme
MGYKVGEKYDMRAIELAKFKDGKIVEHWTFMEPSEMMKMMDNMQPSASTSIPPDSTGKKQ